MDSFENMFRRMVTLKNPNLDEEDKFKINRLVDWCIYNNSIPPKVPKREIYYILKICNAIYNNAPNVFSPLDDDKYDRLIVLCKNLNIEYPIGSEKIDFKLFNDVKIKNRDKKYINNKLEIVTQIPNIHSYKFFSKIARNETPPIKEDFIINHDYSLVEKRERNVQSNYKLCGTLDKFKYITIESAMQNSQSNKIGVVSIFESDFLDKHISKGIVNPNNIELILSLKYDGFSVENEVQGDTIIQSCTRGNVNTGQAVDMTPVFGGMKFARAAGLNDKFAIKFEYIITNQNMELIRRTFNKEYVNNRNAVSGLIGGLDAKLYRDYLTPIPLESSLDMDRLEEIKFLNTYYTKGIDFKHVYIKGDRNQILCMIQQFVKEIDSLRNYMPFMIDGIVVEYRDKNIRKTLGIKNSVPQYAAAIKFDPMKKISTFYYYKFTVGSDGRITPMAYFEPVEFMGATHSFTTVHSYDRFVDLNLRPGDKVILTLVNDVILYLTKAPEEYQDMNNKNKIIEFPTNCPCCGEKIEFSYTNKSAYCPNMNCTERVVNRLGNMIKKLGIRDFSIETIRNLRVKTFKELFTINYLDLEEIIGPVRAMQLKKALDDISKDNSITDYQIFGSIGFTNIAEKTWRLILAKYTVSDILNQTFTSDIVKLKGIGDSTYETIKNELPYFLNDLKFIFDNFNYKVTTGNTDEIKEIVFTGMRDKNIENSAKNKGYEINEILTKNTYILVVPYIGYYSTKVKRVFKLYTKKYNELHKTKIEIDWSNIDLINNHNFTPIIMDIHSFVLYINNI